MIQFLADSTNQGQWSRRAVLISGCAIAAGAAGNARGSVGAGLTLDDGNADVPVPAEGDPGKIIVVGAGIAGLTAARLLKTAGVDVVVIEARERIGGRIHTIDLAGVPVDLGASWVHDGDNSPMLPYIRAKQIGLLPARTVDLVMGATIADVSGGGSACIEPAELHSAIAALESQANALAAKRGNTISLEQAIGEIAPKLSPPIANLFNGLLMMFDGVDSSAIGFGNFAEFIFSTAASANDMFPDGGYRTLVNSLAEGLDIRTGVAAKSISASPAGVEIATSASSYSCSHAIVTASLGVLRSNAIAFDPPLPPEKIQALSRCGFGNFEKVALAYSSPILNAKGSHILTADRDRRAWPLILDMSQWYGEPVLLAITVGTHARELARRPEKDRLEEVASIVRAITGDPTLRPTAGASSAWTTDPFALGCYTSLGRWTERAEFAADIDAIAQPHGRVLFAGEATHRYSSTVDSAWISGVREAKRLLQRSSVVLR